MPPGPLSIAARTRARSGLSSSRLGPKVPSEPAALSVWQLPHLVVNACFGLCAVSLADDPPPPPSELLPHPATTRTARTTMRRMGRSGYIERTVEAGGRTLSLLVPPDAEALIDEDAFAQDEFLPYWAELWPSALALADVPVAGRVLELGCGLGVPSLVAALAGHDVLATDWSQDAIALLRVNARRVGARLEARVWDWRTPRPFDPVPVVMAADVLYEARNAAPLLAALDAVVAPGGEALIADPGRSAAPAFFAAAERDWTLEEAAPRVTRLRRR